MGEHIFKEIIDIIAEQHALEEGSVHYAHILIRYMERNGGRRIDGDELGFGKFHSLMMSIPQVEVMDAQNYHLTLDCWNKHPRNRRSRVSKKNANLADQHPIRDDSKSQGGTEADDDSQYQDALEYLPENRSL